MDQGLEDIIRVDVLRTFTTDKTFPKDQLLNILKCATYVMKTEAGYCQGMNYLAGTLLYMVQDEQKVFEMYLCLVQKRLVEIYIGNFDKLKVYFYVLDNLLNLFVSDLAADLRVKSSVQENHCHLLQLFLVYYTIHSGFAVHEKVSPGAVHIRHVHRKGLQGCFQSNYRDNEFLQRPTYWQVIRGDFDFYR